MPAEAIRTGLFGFNAVLAALALGVIYVRPTLPFLALALLVAALMPLFQLVCGYVLIRIGLPTMSVPFIIATWIVLSVLRPLARLRPAP